VGVSVTVAMIVRVTGMVTATMLVVVVAVVVRVGMHIVGSRANTSTLELTAPRPAEMMAALELERPTARAPQSTLTLSAIAWR
jgi:hypothetical protein